MLFESDKSGFLDWVERKGKGRIWNFNNIIIYFIIRIYVKDILSVERKKKELTTLWTKNCTLCR